MRRQSQLLPYLYHTSIHRYNTTIFLTFYTSSKNDRTAQQLNFQKCDVISLYCSGCLISIRAVGVASKPVEPCPLSFSGYFIYLFQKKIWRKFEVDLCKICFITFKSLRPKQFFSLFFFLNQSMTSYLWIASCIINK